MKLDSANQLYSHAYPMYRAIHKYAGKMPTFIRLINERLIWLAATGKYQPTRGEEDESEATIHTK